MSQQGNKNNGKTSSRWPAGPQVSLGTFVSNGIFLALFMIAAYAMGNYLIPAIALGLFVIVSLYRLLRGASPASLVAQGTDYNDTYQIEGGIVKVEKDGTSWQEPFANYDGVLWRVETLNQRRPRSSRRHRQSTFQIIELRHNKDRRRNVNIYASQELPGMRARWEESARAFNLPALRDLGDGRIISRNPEDLDKSLRELARMGRLNPTFVEKSSGMPQTPSGVIEGQGVRSLLQSGPYTKQTLWADAMSASGSTTSHTLSSKNAPLPSGVRWKHDGDILDIRARKAILPYLLWAAPITALSLFVGYMVPADPFNIMLAFAAPALLLAVWLMVGFRIRVSPDKVSTTTQLGPIPLWHKSVVLDEIEEVLIGQDLFASGAVLVESDNASLKIGPLPDLSAQWLAHFLRQAIACAPEDANNRPKT